MAITVDIERISEEFASKESAFFSSFARSGEIERKSNVIYEIAPTALNGMLRYGIVENGPDKTELQDSPPHKDART